MTWYNILNKSKCIENVSKIVVQSQDVVLYLKIGRKKNEENEDLIFAWDASFLRKLNLKIYQDIYSNEIHSVYFLQNEVANEKILFYIFYLFMNIETLLLIIIFCHVYN